MMKPPVFPLMEVDGPLEVEVRRCGIEGAADGILYLAFPTYGKDGMTLISGVKDHG